MGRDRDFTVKTKIWIKQVQNMQSCQYYTFDNNFGIKYKFKEGLRSCQFGSQQHFSLKYFLKNALVIKISPNCEGIFRPCILE